MAKGSLESLQWFDVAFEPGTLAVIKDTEANKRKERCTCYWKREFFDKLELRLSGAISESCKVVFDELNSRFKEVTPRQFKGKPILLINLCDKRKITKKYWNVVKIR